MSDTLIIAILTPVLVGLSSLFTWLLKAKREETLNEQAKARQFKIDTYKKLLEPFIATFTFTLSAKRKQAEIKKITTLDYRRAMFDLTTFGSDEALLIYNKIMQTFFHPEQFENGEGEKNIHENRLIILISELLLQIRKDIYSKRTKLKRADTIEFMLTDIEEHREEMNNYKIF